MPIIKTPSGYRFGKHGKLYRGSNARSKALKQGRAIHASKRKNEK